MLGIDFDFARYVAYRRGLVEQRAREGGAYSYAGERKVRRALASARPVTLALEATTRLWKHAAKTDLLADAVHVTDEQFPALYHAARQASRPLGLEPPPVYVLPPGSEIRARVLGTNDDCHVMVNAEVLDSLSERELVAVIGHELGHIQNNHVIYTTALYYLRHSAGLLVRWAVQPAIVTLQAWSRRAEITCDRAALIATRDLDATLSSMIRISLGDDRGDFSVEEYLKQLPETRRGIGKYAELFRSHPYLPKRVQALKLFAGSQFYRKLVGRETTGGLSADDLDAKVAEILSVF
jgi:Zn-dependent protease with chaperone function